MAQIRSCFESGNLCIYVPAIDPRYEIKITKYNVQPQGDFFPLEGTEEAIQKLVGAIQRAVEGRFPQTDPTAWSASYNSETNEAFVRLGEGEPVNGTSLALTPDDARELSELRARTIATVFDALSEVYAQIAPESALQVDCEDPEAPRETSSAPSAPNLTLTPRRIVAPKGNSSVPELFATFNRASERLQSQFQGTFLEDLRWQDLLHPDWQKPKFLDGRPIQRNAQALKALENLVDDPHSREEDVLLMKRWFFAIIEEARKERADKALVEGLIVPLEGGYDRNRGTLIEELRKWDKSVLSSSQAAS